jgi:hypothetical protein
VALSTLCGGVDPADDFLMQARFFVIKSYTEEDVHKVSAAQNGLILFAQGD